MSCSHAFIPFVDAWLSDRRVDSHISIDDDRMCYQHRELLLCRCKVAEHCLTATSLLLFPAAYRQMSIKYTVLHMAAPHIFPVAVLG